MGKIKKIIENELIGGTQSTDIYPVTSTKAVYDEDNENLDSILKRRGIINVSTNYNSTHTAETLTLEQAIDKVPLRDRVLGFTMTFLSSDGWKTYQFTGTTINNWANINNWTSFVNDAQLKSNQDSITEKLDTKVNTSAIVQQTGDSMTSVMSQKAVTDALKKVPIKVSEILRPKYTGSQMVVIGDDISTFKGYVHDGFATYYPVLNVAWSDVDSVDKTYWKIIYNALGFSSIQNLSYSKSTLAPTINTIPSLSRRINMVIGEPSLIIIALGMNDSDRNVPIGDFNYDIETTSYTGTFSDEYIRTIRYIKERYPSSDVICLSFYMKDTYADAIHQISEHYGLIYADCRSVKGYTTKYPNAENMADIADFILSNLANSEHGTYTITKGLIENVQNEHIIADMYYSMSKYTGSVDVKEGLSLSYKIKKIGDTSGGSAIVKLIDEVGEVTTVYSTTTLSADLIEGSIVPTKRYVQLSLDGNVKYNIEIRQANTSETDLLKESIDTALGKDLGVTLSDFVKEQHRGIAADGSSNGWYYGDRYSYLVPEAVRSIKVQYSCTNRNVHGGWNDKNTLAIAIYGGDGSITPENLIDKLGFMDIEGIDNMQTFVLQASKVRKVVFVTGLDQDKTTFSISVKNLGIDATNVGYNGGTLSSEIDSMQASVNGTRERIDRRPYITENDRNMIYKSCQSVGIGKDYRWPLCTSGVFKNTERGKVFYRVTGCRWTDGNSDILVNPLINHSAPDPTWIKAGNYFYMCGTGYPFDIYRSVDFVKWERIGQIISNNSELQGRHLMAADLHFINGQYVCYMVDYVSRNIRIIAHTSKDCVNWTYHGEVLASMQTLGLPVPSMDPTYIDGYMVFGSYPNGIATIKMSEDGLSVADGAKATQIVFGQYEGSTVFKYKNYYYLFVSSGHYDRYDYHISICRSTSLEGAFVNKNGAELSKTVLPTTWLSAGAWDMFNGCGHSGNILTDDKGGMYIIYHAHTQHAEVEEPMPRYPCIQKIIEGDDGWLTAVDENDVPTTKPCVVCSVPYIKVPDAYIEDRDWIK